MKPIHKITSPGTNVGGSPGYIDHFIYNKEYNQGGLEFPVAEPYSEQAENNGDQYPGVILRSGMRKILSPFDQGVYHIQQKTKTQEGKEPILPGIKVKPVRIFVFGYIIGKDHISNRVIINNAKGDENILQEGPDFNTGEIVFPPPKVQNQQKHVKNP
jgi:hypothetical protein